MNFCLVLLASLQLLSPRDVRVTDGFWFDRIETNRTATLDACWRKCRETPRLANFENAAKRQGKFGGIYFDDSDVYKVMEGTAYVLATHPDPKREAEMDALIATMTQAQEADGYLYTARTLGLEQVCKFKRWEALDWSHELYNQGHMIEAAVAWHQATGKTNFLAIARKSADLMYRTFGNGPGQLRATSGHEEIELALCKLFSETGERKYLDLAKFFLEMRGRSGRAGRQDHLPVLEQTEAVGHAVRAAYLYCGMADVAVLDNDPRYVAAIDRLWENVVSAKLHLNGGIGAGRAYVHPKWGKSHECFGADYDLPNETAYLETCAAIGNALWNERMFLIHGEAKYVDVLERILYNGFASGVSLSGTEFFYPNPLASKGGYKRRPWFGCSCCPVNDVRFIPQIPRFIFATDASSVYWNLFMSCEAQIRGAKVKVETDYPRSGHAKLTILSQLPTHNSQPTTLKIRIPGWAVGRPVPSGLYRQENPASVMAVCVSVNGYPVNGIPGEDGYLAIGREWKAGDVVTVELPMEVRRIRADLRVAADRGRVAIERGPLVYCAEGADNGGKAFDAQLTTDATFSDLPVAFGDKRCVALRTDAGLTLIPYALWGNREPGNEMQTWLKSEDRILFYGDSITHGGRFIADLQLFENLRHPGSRVRFLNGGRSGGSAWTGLRNLDREIEESRPNRIVVMFGMNDIGRDLWASESPDAKTAAARKKKLDSFRKNMTELVRRIGERGIECVLMTPTPYDQYSDFPVANIPHCNDGLAAAARIVREIARENKLALIELHEPMTKLFAESKEPLCGDRVHPGEKGNLVMANLIWQAFGEAPEEDPFTSANAQVRAKVKIRNELQHVVSAHRNVVLVRRMVEDAKVDPNDFAAADRWLDQWLDGEKEKPYFAGEKAWVDGYRKGRAHERETRTKIDALYEELAKPMSAETVYVRPTMPLDVLNKMELAPGTKVLFLRGGVWRGQLVARSGAPGKPIVYGAYGEGPKPVIEPSRAKDDLRDWHETTTGLWRTQTGAKADIGNVVFDHGASGCGFKKGSMAELTDDLDFWCDPKTFEVVLKSEKNPAVRFASIELCEMIHAVNEAKAHDVIYDGLALRYSAAHGIGGHNVARIVVRNCDVSWIGGGYQYRDDAGRGIRYGNGIEFWADCDDVLVESNRVWACYDAGLTNQSKVDGSVQRNVTYRGNRVWNCEYSYEYWQQGKDPVTRDILLEDNDFSNAGFGWGHRQRWNPNAAHLMFYDTTAATTNFVLRGNRFARSKDCLFRLFNDWLDAMTFQRNSWESEGETLMRYHGRPTANLASRYPGQLDRSHDDNQDEIESGGKGGCVFDANDRAAFLDFIGELPRETILPNAARMWTCWNGRAADWSKFRNEKFPISFPECVELMAATGGHAERDLFKNPEDKTILDDYDFAPLIGVCSNALAKGITPYLKLGGVPLKLSDDFNGGSFRVNIRPPSDPLAHARYMRACASALREAFGRDEVRRWRFAVLTEANNYAWFKTAAGDAASTREAFFSLYDHTVKAFEDELGEGLMIGIHVLNPADMKTSFEPRDFARHCLTGTNAATEKIGAPLRLLTFSHYYDPGQSPRYTPEKSMAKIEAEVATIRAMGCTNLVMGFDEGRVIWAAKGAKKKDLLARATGASYQAAYDVWLAKKTYDLGFEYAATWAWCTGGNGWEGVPSHHYFTQREIAKFAGYMRLADAPADSVVAVSPDGTTVRAMAANFVDRLDYTTRTTRTIALKMPKAFAGQRVTVSNLTLDDRNNWFVDWRRDRAKHGIRNEDFDWSPDGICIMSRRGLNKPEHRRLFAETLQPRYERKAESVAPVETCERVGEDGTLRLSLDFEGNGAAFLTVRTANKQRGSDGITLESLLDEMTDMDDIALADRPSWRGKLWSSYDRRSVKQDDSADGWFANNDWSQWLRVERNGGREECVMVDAKGPGVVTRIWTANGHGTVLRIYMDGANEPTWTGLATNFTFDASIPFPLRNAISPQVQPRHRAYNCYLPIPFSKSIKITAQLGHDDKRFWYNVETRAYENGAAHVESLSPSVLKRAQNAMSIAAEKLLRPGSCENEPPNAHRIKGDAQIRPGSCARIEIAGQAQALCGIHGLPERDVRLRISFDGEETVNLPRPHIIISGLNAAMLPMPFASNCVVTVENTGTAAIDLSRLEVLSRGYAWHNGRSMHFGAHGFEMKDLPTRKGKAGYYDLGWLELEGAGKLMGHALFIDNHAKYGRGCNAWWGEGDEKIYVDGEAFPSYFGTGTEDFFGYAWGPNKPYDAAPFLSMPVSDGRANAEGRHVAEMIRQRRLDAIPFSKSITVDVEIWHWQDTTMDYAPTTFWYAHPGVKIIPSPTRE